MKNLILILISCLVLNLKAQQTGIITSTILVKGNCEDCKKRIENAADIKGVKICTWDADSKVAKITYNTSLVTLVQIETAIAKAGYDAGDIKGDDKTYNKLPKCCKYRNGACEKPKQ